jgi:TRAP-type mannitol/chloroaromatic compound transport system permease large subunit
MDTSTLILIIMLFSTFALLLSGFPVAFVLGGSSLFFGIIGAIFGVFDMGFISALPLRIYGNAIVNEILIAVPLFVFMGIVLERSQIAEELLDTMGKLFGKLPGGLGISVSIVGALLAASTGIVGATVVTMGLLSLPTMIRRHYDPSLACGSICAAGTLGQIIPPSIVLIILGEQISNAYTDAQRAVGNWSPEPISVGDLFAGALLPGLMLVGFYVLYQTFIAIRHPERCPPVPKDEIHLDGGFFLHVLQVMCPPLLLIVAVLGSILMGLATPTESAAIGAIGAVLLAGQRVGRTKPEQKISPLKRFLFALDVKGANPSLIALFALVAMFILKSLFDLRLQRVALPTVDLLALIAAFALATLVIWGILVTLHRIQCKNILFPIIEDSAHITNLVFTILIGAAMFSLVFRGYNGDEIVQEFLLNFPGGIYTSLVIVMIVIFILGFFLDFIEICFIVVPLIAPVLLANDVISPLWLGVLIAMNLQTSFLTPPFGFALFYLRGVAPPEIKTLEIYKGVLPFIIIQIIAILCVAFIPELSSWLPNVIYGTKF